MSGGENIPVAINGMGRIGRCLLRLLFERSDLPLTPVAVNNPGPIQNYLHLLQYDSVHGRLNRKIEAHGEDSFSVEGKRIAFFHEKHPRDIPWESAKARVVLDSTGKFKKRADLGEHRADKVILCAPGEDLDGTFVMGVNDHTYQGDRHHIVSNASCTTNCLAPVAKALHEAFGIADGMITTVHAYTSDQRLLDGSHKDLRRARAAALSMVPTGTGAARAVGLVLPELAGKLDGFAVRVPTPNVSLVDLTFRPERTADSARVNQALREAAEGKLRGILTCQEAPLVSADFVGLRESAAVDLPLTNTCGDLIKVICWYDNEMGFSHRVLELAALAGGR